ncbi:hypothetical protein SALB1_2991 [Salinisphaera sp. LB1]|nr:hypothetical protein SALB1_2991 [Salinisphaera sp. LB1]
MGVEASLRIPQGAATQRIRSRGDRPPQVEAERHPMAVIHGSRDRPSAPFTLATSRFLPRRSAGIRIRRHSRFGSILRK